MSLQVGDRVQVLNTDCISTRVQVGDVGVVVSYIMQGYTKVYFDSINLYQYFLTDQINPVTEVIKVNCRKPSVLQRIWNYLRGIK